MKSMRRFFLQLSRAIAKIFSPGSPEIMPDVGFQPISDDVYRHKGSTCYASDLDPDL